MVSTQIRFARAVRMAATSLFLGMIALPLVLGAQAQDDKPDVIRGRITDDSSRAVTGAAISVTRGPDRLTQQTTSDSAGNFRVRFEQGTGDYLVYVSATGFAPARRR